MPEYRNVLSVADLLDLVAYLEAQGACIGMGLDRCYRSPCVTSSRC